MIFNKTIIIGNSNSVRDTKKKTIKHLKQSNDYIFANSDGEISINGDTFEVSLSYLGITEKLLNIFNRDEINYFIDFAEKMNKAEKREDIQEKEFDKYVKIIHEIEDRQLERIDRGEDISIR